MKLAEYKCEKCKYEYKHLPQVTQCPRCGHLWVKWTNYDEMFGDRILELEYLEKLNEIKKLHR